MVTKTSADFTFDRTGIHRTNTQVGQKIEDQFGDIDTDLEAFKAAIEANEPGPFIHADDTTVNPATAGDPTAAEITVFTTAGGHTDAIVYYTGDDTASPGNVTHVFKVDTAGAVIALQVPSTVAAGIYDADGNLDAARAVTMDGNDLELIGDNAQRSTLFRHQGLHDALEWRRKKQGFIFGAGTFTPDLTQYGRMNVGIADTDVGDLTVAPPTIDSFEGYANRYEFSVGNVDTVARNVVFDTHYKDNQGNDLGTQVVQPGTYRHWNFHYESGLLAGSYLDSELVTPSAAVATVIDSSGGAVTETLPPATGSGAILFYANEDVTNTASLVPAAGEQLNGVVDKLWEFDNYPAGTQFIATDTGTGKWSVAVDGASTQTPLEWLSIYYSAASGYTGSVTTDQGGTYVVVDLASANLSSEGESSWINGTTVVVPKTTAYDITVAYNDTTSLSAWGLYINGVKLTSAYSGNIQSGDDWTQPLILNLTAGDVLEFGAVSPDNPSDPIGSFYWKIAQRATTETVLAGMVTPSPSARAVVKLSADWNNVSANNAWQVLEFDTTTHDSAAAFDAANFKYVVPTDGDYHTDLVISYINNSASSNDPMDVAVRLNGTSELLQLRHDISDQIGAAGGLTVTLSGLLPGLTAGDELTIEAFDADDVITHVAASTSWSIQHLPTGTVVMPDTTEVDVVDWTDYPVAIGADTTDPVPSAGNHTLVGKYRKIGNHLSILVRYDHTSAGTSGTGRYYFTLPAGYTPDPAFVSITENEDDLHKIFKVGSVAVSDSSASGEGPVSVRSNGLYMHADDDGGAKQLIDSTWYDLGTATMGISVSAEIPILP